jgi:5-(carboxyamino)imidazole ribonucleotide mutase
MTETSGKPLVGICMGSKSDLPTMQSACDTLRDFDVPFEVRVVSAHRTPQVMYEYGSSAIDRGLEVLIAGAGGAAHLPGMLAALTVLPVIGVPVPLRHLDGLDSLLSIVQMPRGTPVATVAIGQAANAAHLALRILANGRPEIRRALEQYRATQISSVGEHDREVSAATKNDPGAAS